MSTLPKARHTRHTRGTFCADPINNEIAHQPRHQTQQYKVPSPHCTWFAFCAARRALSIVATNAIMSWSALAPGEGGVLPARRALLGTPGSCGLSAEMASASITAASASANASFVPRKSLKILLLLNSRKYKKCACFNSVY